MTLEADATMRRLEAELMLPSALMQLARISTVVTAVTGWDSQGSSTGSRCFIRSTSHCSCTSTLSPAAVEARGSVVSGSAPGWGASHRTAPSTKCTACDSSSSGMGAASGSPSVTTSDKMYASIMTAVWPREARESPPVALHSAARRTCALAVPDPRPMRRSWVNAAAPTPNGTTHAR